MQAEGAEAERAAQAAASARGVVLFDMDGTLMEADHLHHKAWQIVLGPHGVEISTERYRNEIMGAPNSTIMRTLLPAMALEVAMLLAEEKERTFRSLVVELEPAAGLGDFLVFLDSHEVAMAVVTNAPRANAELQLAGVRLAERFTTLVIGDELAHAKPHPLPYLTGLELLGGHAARSLAFEDSLSGVRSARAAGLEVVGLATGLSPERLEAEGAALAIRDFTDPRLIPFVTRRLVLG